MEILGERIKKLRLAKNMTRKQLGFIVELKNPDSRIEAYETGKKFPRKDMLSKFAEALNVSENYLLTGVLDNESISNLYTEGILDKNAFNDDKKPRYYFQLNQLIMNNENLIEQCLLKEDYEKIADLIYERILEKKGNLNDVLPFMTVDEYNEYCIDQAGEQEKYEIEQYEEEQRMIRLGKAFYDDKSILHPTPTCEEEEEQYINEGLAYVDKNNHLVLGTSSKNNDKKSGH